MGCSSSKSAAQPQGPTLLKPSADGKPSMASEESLDRYLNPEGLRDVFESGAVRLLRGSYIVKLYESGLPILRRQDLPDEAFWTAEEVMEHLTDPTVHQTTVVNNENVKGIPGMNFILALSYRWTEPGHPDKSRHHLKTVAQFVKFYLTHARICFKLPDVAVFWDFPCLFQKDRTKEETRLFQKGLGYANLIYGHRYTFVLMQKSQPKDIPKELPYSHSGWCTFESIVGSLNKPSTSYWDISPLGEMKLGGDHHEMFGVCGRATKRPVPLAPWRMKAVLDQARFTNGKTDQSVVENMYAEIAQTIMSTTKSLDLNNQTYTEEEVDMMAEILPLHTSCTSLSLFGTDLGEHGANVLAPALKKMPSLKNIGVGCKVFGPNTPSLLAQTIPPNLSALAIANVAGRGAKKASDDECMSLLKALTAWIGHPDSPKTLDVSNGFTSVNNGRFTNGIKRAWNDAGKNPDDLIWLGF